MSYRFLHSKSCTSTQELVKILHCYMLFNFELDDPVVSEIRKLAKNIFSQDTNEIGEINLYTDSLTPIIASIMLLANPNAMSKEIQNILFSKDAVKTKMRNLKTGENILTENTFALKHNFGVYGSFVKTNLKDNLINLILAFDTFIAQNDGYILPKEQQIIQPTISKKEKIAKDIEYYELYTLEELTQKRREVSSEENNSKGLHFYNPLLAQQLDKLMESRYTQFTNRFIAIQKKDDKKSDIEVISILSKIYNIEFVVEGKPTVFGYNFLANINFTFKNIYKYLCNIQNLRTQTKNQKK